jgi:hypothetical protein
MKELYFKNLGMMEKLFAKAELRQVEASQSESSALNSLLSSPLLGHLFKQGESVLVTSFLLKLR